jgi:DNA-binding NtrC family response regulator
MVLIVDDNIKLVEDLIDELELEEIEVQAVHNATDYIKLLDNEEIRNYSTIVMDYNLEDSLNGINLLQTSHKEYFELFQNVKSVFYSGNINYISKEEKKFLEEKNIEAISKTEISKLIDKIIELES